MLVVLVELPLQVLSYRDGVVVICFRLAGRSSLSLVVHLGVVGPTLPLAGPQSVEALLEVPPVAGLLQLGCLLPTVRIERA